MKKLIIILTILVLPILISCNIEDGGLNDDPIAHVRIQNDSVGYYEYRDVVFNGVDFGSISSGQTSEYLKLPAEEYISFTMDFINAITGIKERTASQSTFGIYVSSLDPDKYYTFRFYLDVDNSKLMLEVTDSSKSQGNVTTYLEYPDPIITVKNTTGKVLLENLKINDIDFGTVNDGETLSPITVSGNKVITLSVDIIDKATGEKLGSATADTFVLKGCFLKGLSYTLDFYYISSYKKILLSREHVKQ